MSDKRNRSHEKVIQLKKKIRDERNLSILLSLANCSNREEIKDFHDWRSSISLA